MAPAKLAADGPRIRGERRAARGARLRCERSYEERSKESLPADARRRSIVRGRALLVEHPNDLRFSSAGSKGRGPLADQAVKRLSAMI